MSQMQPKCYGCDQKAAIGRMFCTTRCAAGYAEELIRGNGEEWCPLCEQWVGTQSYDKEHLSCQHKANGITEGMSHTMAANRFRVVHEGDKS